MRALVVDDSAVMRKVLIGALSRADINDVEQAADGAESVAMCQAQDFDLVLMDWNMPNMDGPTFVRTFRERGHTTPVIMVTTLTHPARRAQALDAGATGFLSKPFTPEDAPPDTEQQASSSADQTQGVTIDP